MRGGDDKIYSVLEDLRANTDREYADFNSKLIPNVAKTSMLGVRVPTLRKIAKKMVEERCEAVFLEDLPHKYFEENMLHSILVSSVKDFDLCVDLVDKFLPYVDNWAVCDILSPKVLARDKEKLLKKIDDWIKIGEEYTVRFGISMLMQHFLDDDFQEVYLKKVAEIRMDKYYVKMMQAWYFATALAKRWNEAIKIIEQKKLDSWTHNKSIQKAIESYRVPNEHKNYLRSLRLLGQ